MTPPESYQILGEPAAREFLQVLEQPDEERAALIGRLHAGDEKRRRMAELLTGLEDEVGEIGRLRFIEALRREFGSSHGP